MVKKSIYGRYHCFYSYKKECNEGCRELYDKVNGECTKKIIQMERDVNVDLYSDYTIFVFLYDETRKIFVQFNSKNYDNAENSLHVGYSHLDDIHRLINAVGINYCFNRTIALKMIDAYIRS